MNDITEIFFKYQLDFFRNKKKRKIWVSSRQLGKSFTIAALLCYKALAKKNGLSLCISTGARASSEIIRKCCLFAEAIKVLSKGLVTFTSTFDLVKFSTGSRIVSLPSTTDGSNLRGFTAQCVCIDEAAYIPHLDMIMAAINPTLSRDKDAELVLTTTPAGKNGHFYLLYLDALVDDRWYVLTTTIHDAIADGLDVDLGSLHSLCPDPDVWKQEYECFFSDEFGAMLDPQLLEFYDELDGDCAGYDGVYFSADIGRTHDKTSIVICKTKRDVVYVDAVVTLSKCEYLKQLEVFRKLNEKFRFTAGYIDLGGIGSAVAEFATKQVSSRIKGFTFTGTNKTPAYELVRDKVFLHKIKFNLKYKKAIVDDFRNVQRIVTEDGKVKYVAGSNDLGHSDFVSSLVLNILAIHDNRVNSRLPTAFIRNSAFGLMQHRL